MNRMKLTATLILSGLCLNSTSISAKTFEIDVRVAGLPGFTDCMTFGGAGEFRLGRDPLKLSWTNDMSRRFVNGFVATTPGGDRIGTKLRLAIHGRIYSTVIVGNMVNNYGQTFMFRGNANENCKTVGALSAGSSEYSALPVFAFKPVSAWPDYEIPGPILGRLLQSNSDEQYMRTLDDVARQPCFGFNCGLPPQPQSVSDVEGQPSFVVGRSYRVILNPDNSLAKLIEDCWKFAADGSLENEIGTELIWRMDSHNTAIPTFQSVGVGGTQHGMAFHGMTLGSTALEVSGMRSFRGVITRYSGHGIPVKGC